MTTTKSTLPDLSSNYLLTAPQISDYQRSGHALIRGLATPDEVAAYRPLLLDAVERNKQEIRPLAERDTYGKAFLQIMNLWVGDERVRRFVLARRFAQVAADLMGVNGVRIYHDQALFKEPGGGPTPWHQDQHYWPLETDKTITLWMPLVNVSQESGTMRFASGSHSVGYLGDMPISDHSDAALQTFIQEKGYQTTTYGAMAAGDATFHSGWTLHGAPGNPTQTMREVMTIIYFADGTRVGAADNANRQNDLAGWLPGLAPGDLAASEINPLVYHREIP